MKTFEKLENRYIFSGKLILEEALHIGSGESREDVDSPFVMSGGKRYIPGSSLRGALRSTVERIAYSLEKNSCLLFDSDSSKCMSVDGDLRTAYQKLAEKTEEELRRTDGQQQKTKEQRLIEFLDKHLCDTCKLFGSPYFASKIKITDLYPSDKSDPEGIVRYGIAIDRDTGTTVKGALFDREVVEKNHGFDFEIIGENLDEDDFGLLCVGLSEMLWGDFYIGADSASGLGKCKLQSLKIKYFDESDKDGFNLKHYLTKSGEERWGWKRLTGEVYKFIQQKRDDYLSKESKHA